MRYVISFLVLFIGISANAQVQFSGVTQHAIHNIKRQLKRGDRSDVSKLRSQYAIVSINGIAHLSMMAKLSVDFDVSELTGNILVGSQIGDIATLKVPLSELGRLNKLKGIQHIEIAHKVVPDVKSAVLDVHADSVHQGLGIDVAYTGKNVIIGVTDWGFDYTHPMFYDTALNQTRILASWDQFKKSGPAPMGMSYGTEYNGETELFAAQSDTACTYYNYATHGSHVAGIAAGGGAGIGEKGVAFDANYLFCAIHLDGGSVIDAVSWMKSKAEEEGKRLVVNMSWGLYHIGALDGTSLLSQALDNFSDQGVIIVTSGGNNGAVDFHIKKEFNQDSIVTKVDFYPYSAHESMWGQSISIWGEKNNAFKIAFEVRNVNDFVVAKTPIYSTSTAASYLDSVIVLGTDTVLFNLAVDASYPTNQRPYMRLRIKNTNTSLKIVLRSYAENGVVHYWNVTELENGAGNWGMPFSNVSGGNAVGDAKYAIGEPATTKSVIAVGAHSSEVRTSSGFVINGSLAGFSSEGPTMDDRIKPDVSGPGVSVLSAISSFTTGSYTTARSTNFNGRKYDFARLSGTSMSSPAVAGVVALMLEANPHLSSNQVKNILKNTAREDNRTGTIPLAGSTEWGWGKANAVTAIELAKQTVGVETPKRKKDILLYPNPSSSILNFYSTNQQTFDIEVYSIVGEKVIEKRNVSKQLDIENLPAGAYIIYLKQNEKQSKTLKFIKE